MTTNMMNMIAYLTANLRIVLISKAIRTSLKHFYLILTFFLFKKSFEDFCTLFMNYIQTLKLQLLLYRELTEIQFFKQMKPTCLGTTLLEKNLLKHQKVGLSYT